MSQAHFQGRFEVEFKYQLTDRPAFLKALLALNPEIMLEDNLEQDRYFDTPDDALAQAGKSLAIRTMQPSGIQLWIVKGPETDRCEAVNINNADKAVSMLLTMNYRQILVITKRRSIYFIGPFHVTLDHLAEIGDFAELAIMTDDEERLPAFRQQLLALADQLGLSPDAQEPRSYRTLYMQAIHTTQTEDATQ
ncbi:class IV adenylate cyclase [Aeromonas veronii]|uniref:class IV adenylate cyclase n=2 Tax=Aeromonas veronii TaxID=654 RepID=UPI001116ECAC|nr:class IV adenylate cyclase [Aeromonas veronii]TNI48612.1 adenylate cyclase [Aeromonas veronii]TNI52723.1 adenylate cyclase [Aeromonas veronii]